MLTIIDDVTRECLAAVPDTSPSGKRVREMDAPIAWRGLTGAIVSDSGTEFTSSAVLAFTQAAKLDRRCTAPGKPTRNAFAESFQGRMRDECLNGHLFFSMNHARAAVAGWVEDFHTGLQRGTSTRDFNTARPHSAISYRVACAETLKTATGAGAALPGTTSSTSRGASDPSEIAIGQKGSDQCGLV